MEHERNTNNGWVWQQMKPFPADYLKERDRILGAAANKEARMETGLRLLEAFSEKTIMGEYSCGETILTKLETDYSKANGQKFYHGTVMGKQRECKACGLKTHCSKWIWHKEYTKGALARCNRKGRTSTKVIRMHKSIQQYMFPLEEDLIMGQVNTPPTDRPPRQDETQQHALDQAQPVKCMQRPNLRQTTLHTESPKKHSDLKIFSWSMGGSQHVIPTLIQFMKDANVDIGCLQ